MNIFPSIPEVDNYLSEGCGRCPLGATPECKVHNWTDELQMLRALILECGLREELKWGAPSYTVDGKNILMLAALRENVVLSFFKGSLLLDEEQILEKPGDNTRSARVIRFTGLETISKLKPVLQNYIFEAMEVEKAGLKVDFSENRNLKYSVELEDKLESDPVFRAAFEALTPGRKRGYHLYISSSKQEKTRLARIEKCTPMIMEGIGLHDHYGRK